MALEDLLDKEKVNNRDILEYGMNLVVDCKQSEFIKCVLKNIIEQENDKYKKTLMNIQAEAVLCIHSGDTPGADLYHKMNSYTDLSLTDDPGSRVLDDTSKGSLTDAEINTLLKNVKD